MANLRDCYGHVINTIGPTPARYRPLPRTTIEIAEILQPSSRGAMSQADARAWLESQVNKVPDFRKGIDFKRQCAEIAASFLKASSRTQNLRHWAEVAERFKGVGPLPRGIYNERHLLNSALDHVKCAFEAMASFAKCAELNEEGNPTRAVALQYFMKVYQLELVLMRAAHSQNFDEWFELGDRMYHDPDRYVKFDNIEPLETYILQAPLNSISLGSLLPPKHQKPLSFQPFRDADSEHLPLFSLNEDPDGPDVIFNCSEAAENKNAAEAEAVSKEADRNGPENSNAGRSAFWHVTLGKSD